LKKHCKIKRLLRKQQILWNSLTITCGDGSIDVKSTEVRTANGIEIKGFREFGVNIIGLLQTLFFVYMRTGLL
jgi:hypothetical protein